MSVDPIQEAARLIEAKHYFEAQTLLASLNSPAAKAMLAKLDAFLDQPAHAAPSAPQAPFDPAQPRIDKTTFFCERCGRQAGPEMVKCDNRDAGTCPYTLKHAPTGTIGSAILGLVFFGAFFVLPLLAYLNTTQPPATISCFIIPFLTVGMAALGFAIYSFLGHEAALFNPANGFAWYKLAFLGVPVKHIVTLGIQPLPLDLSTVRRLHGDYPPSTQTLKLENAVVVSTTPAVLCLKAALLGLMAGDVLITGVPKRYRGRFGAALQPVHQPTVTLMVNTANVQAVEGALERKLITQMMRWQADGKAAIHGGMTVVDVCRALFEGERVTNSYTWVLDVARQDAANRGMGQLTPHSVGIGPIRTSVMRYQPSNESKHLAAQAGVIVSEFERLNPQFGAHLNKQLIRGLSLMNPSD